MAQEKGARIVEASKRKLFDKFQKAKPSALLVDQLREFEFCYLKTAKQIGLTIPPNVLARADKVIK